ncbi:MAG TPA: dihydropteroate synthase [Novimethylophilus sp.]|jgi:dihydropteroate synthase|uniref:dihydropteroate synthase n=1 Tax=Novimethylophilus sp. TaxID=2137426 RepID=UPI002F3E609F
MHFDCGSYQLDLACPRVMGIVNVTPDSFSDGGRYASTQLAIEHGVRLVAEGADILDIGGESTRPGAEPVPLDEELKRVIPVIEGLVNLVDVPISIDTYKPEVMRAAIAAGADLINDVQALQEPGALEAVASSNAGVCLMHMLGTPQTMQTDPQYDDVVAEVLEFLRLRAEAAVAAGIARERIMLDPGFGFAKRSVHNIALLRELPKLCALGYPVLAGLSRKSVLGHITGNRVEDRLPPSIAAAVVAVMKGAGVVRVHDVKATKDALAVVAAIID